MPNSNRRISVPRHIAGWGSVAAVIVIGIGWYRDQSIRSQTPAGFAAQVFDPASYMAGFSFYQPGASDFDAAKLPPVGDIDPQSLQPGFVAIELNYKQIEDVKFLDGNGTVEKIFACRKTFLVHQSTLQAMQQDANIQDDWDRNEFLPRHGGMLHSFNGQPSSVKIDLGNGLIVDRYWTDRGNFARGNALPPIETPYELRWVNTQGQPHRTNGPAIIQANYMAWYKNGVLHRDDGPAIVTRAAIQYWWNGQQCATVEEFNKLKSQKIIPPQKQNGRG